MGGSSHRIEFLTTLAELSRFRPEWEAVYAESAASPYLAIDWVRTGLQYFTPTGGFYLAVVRDESGVRAIVPLEIESAKIGPLRQRVLRFALEGWGLRNGPILSRRASGEGFRTILAAADGLNRAGIHWDYCRLSLVPERLSDALPNLETALRRHRMSSAECVNAGSSVVIELPGTWEEYYRKFSKNRREKIRKSNRLLGEKGALRMVRLGLDPGCEEDSLRLLIGDSLEVCSRSWQGDSVVGHAIGDADVREFFTEVSHRMAARGMLDLSVVYAAERPVSYNWGMARWPWTTINKLGFDRELSHCSPGSYHMTSLIEDSISRGGREIDFGNEFQEHKRVWGTREDELYHVFLYPQGLVPNIVRLLRSAKRTLTRRGPDAGT